MYAFNSHGYSVEPGLPTPQFLSPKRAPDPPGAVHISPQSGSEIQVSFSPSDDDGGAPVLKYKVEWNVMSFFPGMLSMNSDPTALLYSSYNVQTIQLSAEEEDIGGFFRIAFRGHCTEEISAKSTANDMKNALETLPTIGSVIVSREFNSDGLIWAITFLTNHGHSAGHQGNYGAIEKLLVSTDPAALPQMFVTDTLGVPGLSLGTGARLLVTEEVTAFKGYEQQTLTTLCGCSTGNENCILGGHFALSFEGMKTNEIPFNAMASDLKLELEAIDSLGTVKVIRRGVANGAEWTIIFLDYLGNAPLLDVDNHLTCSLSGSPLAFVVETFQVKC